MGIGEISPQSFAGLKLVRFDQSAAIAPAPARKPDQGTFVFIDYNPGAANVSVDPALA
jgi:hypothetical protein